MANTGFLLLSLVFIVLTGCDLCLSIECNGDNVDNCERGKIKNDCPEYRSIVKCLRKLDDCQDNQLQQFVTNTIQLFDRAITNCPNLPDGQCYHLVMGECQKHVPYKVKYSSSISQDDVKLACQGFNGKLDLVKTCMENIRPKCPVKKYQQTISESIKTVEEINTICQQYTQ